MDGDDIGDGGAGPGAALGVPVKHDFNLDADATLAEEDVQARGFDVLPDGVTGRDHVPILELHSLATLAAELAGHDNLGTLGTVLHDEAEDAVARAAHGEASEELVPERLSLGNGAETAVGNLLGVELDGALGEAKTLLDEGGELANAAALLAENVLGAGGADDDLGAHGGHADLDAGVAILGELTDEELVELGEEDAVRDELLEWRRGENVQVSESRGAWVEKQSAGGGGKP